MTVTATANYGTELTVAGISGLKVISIDAPIPKIGIIETTYHGSGSWREHITDGLMGMAAFKVTVEASGPVVGDIYTVFAAGAAVACVFTENGFPAWTFNGMLESFDLGKADAQKPDEEQVILTIQPTGALTVAAAAGNWYTNVTSLFLDVGDYAILTGGTHQLVVYAVSPGLAPFIAPIANLTFLSSDTGKATVSAGGLLTGVAAGSTYVKVSITAKTSVNTTIKVTDS